MHLLPTKPPAGTHLPDECRKALLKRLKGPR